MKYVVPGMSYRGVLKRISLLFTALLLLAGCKIVKIEDAGKKKPGGSKDGVSFYFENENFNADQMVQDIWGSKVMPYMMEKAADISEVVSLLLTDKEKAGEQFGTHRKGDGEPWNFVVTGEGVITSVDTSSRVGKMMVEIPSLTGQELVIQIGPVIKESSIRDSLDFISFDNFVNQIEFANLSNAFNKMVKEEVIGTTDFEQKVGSTIRFYGAFTMPEDSSTVILTPVKVEVIDN